MFLNTKEGVQTLGSGAIGDLRSDKTGALVITQGHGRMMEAALKGNLFGVCNQAGITTQAGLSATTPALTLYNPAGSGINCVLYYAGVSFSVAFAAAALVYVAVGTNTVAAAVTGTLTTAHRNLLLGSASSPRCIPLLAATLPAAPVAVSILGVGVTGAITTVPYQQTMGRVFDGSIVLTPGTNLSIQTSTASGASATFCEYVWEEVTA